MCYFHSVKCVIFYHQRISQLLIKSPFPSDSLQEFSNHINVEPVLTVVRLLGKHGLPRGTETSSGRSPLTTDNQRACSVFWRRSLGVVRVGQFNLSFIFTYQACGDKTQPEGASMYTWSFGPFNNIFVHQTYRDTLPSPAGSVYPNEREQFNEQHIAPLLTTSTCLPREKNGFFSVSFKIIDIGLCVNQTVTTLAWRCTLIFVVDVLNIIM